MTQNSQLPIASASKALATFWQQGNFSTFNGIDNIKIHFATFTNQTNHQCLVISPGRVESYIKYQELAFELYQHGYNIFIIDHRGQGLSQRMTTNPHKGYVKRFDDYADDLATFITGHVNPSCLPGTKPLLLAHSMGGAIGTRVLQLHPNLVKAAVLSSPMFAINSGGIPLWLAKNLIHSGAFLNNVLSSEPWYFLGQNDYKAKEFADNILTHSPSRYQTFIKRYQQHQHVQLGGVTFQWLSQALQTNKDIFNDIDKIKTPVLILQAGEDSIVDSATQDDFCHALYQRNTQLCSSHKPYKINGAYHELFFEDDTYRQQALNKTLNWLKQHH
ncbi:alpha/beta fold hydrolase [Thalassotalea piscium]